MLGTPPGTSVTLSDSAPTVNKWDLVEVELLPAVVAPTVSTPTSTVNPSVFGQSITFSSTVSGGAGTPTGTVTFYDGGTAISGAVTVNGSGTATYATSTLSVASHSITAQYSGDSTYASGTSSALTQVVNAGTLSVSAPGPVTLSPNPAPGTSTGPYALGTLTFINTLFDGAVWSVTMTATDFYDTGSSKIGIPFTNLTINVDQAPAAQSGAFGTVTPGAATQTLTGSDGTPGTTPSDPITLASAAGSNAAQGTWTTANTLSIVTPANSTQHTYQATIQYTITG